MTCNKSNNGANRMGSLCCHPDCQLTFSFFVTGYTTTGFNRSNVNSRDIDLFFDHHVRLIESLFSGFLITCLPMPDMVICSTFLVWSQQRSICIQGLVWINERLHRLIFNRIFQSLYRISGNIAVCSNHSSHFLRLIHHRISG